MEENAPRADSPLGEGTMTNLIDLPLFAIMMLAAVLFAAGMTKGVIGVGLPIVAVPLLSMIVPLPTAVAIVAIPLLLTNLTQACTGDPSLSRSRRFGRSSPAQPPDLSPACIS